MRLRRELRTVGPQPRDFCRNALRDVHRAAHDLARRDAEDGVAENQACGGGHDGTWYRDAE